LHSGYSTLTPRVRSGWMIVVSEPK